MTIFILEVVVVVIAAGTACVREALGLRLLRLVTRLCACTARDVRLFATCAPLAACDCTVVETDRVAQLVELLLRELARITDAQTVERQVCERDTLKLVDVEPERLDHPVNLAVLAFVDRDREPRVLAFARENLDVGWHRDRSVVELDTGTQPLHVIVTELAVHLDVVRLRHVTRRRQQFGRELTVVRQEEHAFRVEVETTDWLYRNRKVRHVVHHHWTTTVIRDGGDAALRLVE